MAGGFDLDSESESLGGKWDPITESDFLARCSLQTKFCIT